MAPLVGLLAGPVLGMIEKIIDRTFPDKAAADRAKLEMLALAQTQEFQQGIEQIKVNAAEASSGSAYAAGWRPTVGYICAAGLAYNFIVYPLLTWGLAVAGSEVMPPDLISDNLMELILGMLGLGGLRTVEKIKGATK